MKSQNKKLTIVVNSAGKKSYLLGKQGQNLLDILQTKGIMISASCGGKGSCKKCKVQFNNGTYVLACQYTLTNDLSINIPDTEHFVILDELNPHSKKLENNSGLTIVRHGERIDLKYKNRRIAGLKSRNETNTLLGLAVDIGTTTIVVYLVDLVRYEVVAKQSYVNPQASFGSDVISRIEYCISKQNGLQTLQNAIIDSINREIKGLCSVTGTRATDIYLATIVGNTVMLHLFLGIDPKSIAYAPYKPSFVDEKSIDGASLELHMHPNAMVRLLPSVAGYVGADIVAGLAATDMTEKKSYTLYIDIGTNGEIVLGNREAFYSCATAAGPAFEGARIQCGVGGVEGAISEYFDGRYKTIGNKSAIGICGSGLVDIIAYLLEEKRIDASGLMDVDFVIETKSKTDLDHDIVLTQKDVREVQLAKAAIFAGIKTLVGVAGISAEMIDAVYLAGGFGNFIRPESAVRIGMLPLELQNHIIPIGNSAGTGALLALKSIEFDFEIEKVLNRMTYIELSMRSDFNDYYIEAMNFIEQA